MTLDEFLKLAYNGVVIECQNIQQRKEVLELFIECGFEIGLASQSYLNSKYRNATFMHPSFTPTRGCVACYTNFKSAIAQVGNGIRYEDVRSLIENPPRIDERSDEEFIAAFSELISEEA